MTQQIPEWLEELLNEWLFVTVGMSHKHTDVKVGFYKCYELLSKPEFAAKIECVKPVIEALQTVYNEEFEGEENRPIYGIVEEALKPFQGVKNESI